MAFHFRISLINVDDDEEKERGKVNGEGLATGFRERRANAMYLPSSLFQLTYIYGVQRSSYLFVCYLPISKQKAAVVYTSHHPHSKRDIPKLNNLMCISAANKER